MNKIVNDVEYYTFPITIPIYKIKPPKNFQKYYQTHKDEIIVDLQKKNKTLKQELQRKDNEINDLKSSIADYQEAVGDYQDELKRKDNIINELKNELYHIYNYAGLEIKDLEDKIKDLENDN